MDIFIAKITVANVARTKAVFLMVVISVGSYYGGSGMVAVAGLKHAGYSEPVCWFLRGDADVFVQVRGEDVQEAPEGFFEGMIAVVAVVGLP